MYFILFHYIHSIIQILLCRFSLYELHYANFYHSVDSIMQILFCGFYCADFIVHILLFGFYCMDSIIWILLCRLSLYGIHYTDLIVQIPSCKYLLCKHTNSIMRNPIILMFIIQILLYNFIMQLHYGIVLYKWYCMDCIIQQATRFQFQLALATKQKLKARQFIIQHLNIIFFSNYYCFIANSRIKKIMAKKNCFLNKNALQLGS